MVPVDQQPVSGVRADNSDDMVVRIGTDGIRRYVSPASTKLLGLTPEQMVCHPVRDQIEAEDLPTVWRGLSGFIGVRSIPLIAYRIRRPDGGTVWLESAVRNAVHPLSGKADGIVAITRDVTARKRLEGKFYGPCPHRWPGRPGEPAHV